MADKIRIVQIKKAFSSNNKENKNSENDKFWFEDDANASISVDFDKTIDIENYNSSKINLVQNANSHFFKPEPSMDFTFKKSDIENPMFESLNILDRSINKKPSNIREEILDLRRMSYENEQLEKEKLLEKLNVDLKFKDNFKNYNLVEKIKQNYVSENNLNKEQEIKRNQDINISSTLNDNQFQNQNFLKKDENKNQNSSEKIEQNYVVKNNINKGQEVQINEYANNSSTLNDNQFQNQNFLKKEENKNQKLLDQKPLNAKPKDWFKNSIYFENLENGFLTKKTSLENLKYFSKMNYLLFINKNSNLNQNKNDSLQDNKIENLKSTKVFLQESIEKKELNEPLNQTLPFVNLKNKINEKTELESKDNDISNIENLMETKQDNNFVDDKLVLDNIKNNEKVNVVLNEHEKKQTNASVENFLNHNFIILDSEKSENILPSRIKNLNSNLEKNSLENYTEPLKMANFENSNYSIEKENLIFNKNSNLNSKTDFFKKPIEKEMDLNELNDFLDNSRNLSLPVINNFDYTVSNVTDDLQRAINKLEESSEKLREKERFFEQKNNTTQLVNSLVNEAKEIQNQPLESSKFDDFENWFSKSKDIKKVAKIAKKEKKNIKKLNKK